MLSDLQVEFFLAQTSEQLNVFFMLSGAKGVLKSKNYSAIEMVFLSIAAIID